MDPDEIQRALDRIRSENLSLQQRIREIEDTRRVERVRGTQNRATSTFQDVDEEGNITFFINGRATSGVSSNDSAVLRNSFDSIVSAVSDGNPSLQGLVFRSIRDRNGNLRWLVSPPDGENTGQGGLEGIPSRQEIYGDIIRRGGENLEEAFTQILTVAGREIAISIAIAPIGRLATLLLSLGGRGVRSSFLQLSNLIRRGRYDDIRAALQTLNHSSLQSLDRILTSVRRGNPLTTNQISEANRILGILERELNNIAQSLPSRYSNPINAQQLNRIRELSQGARTQLQTILLNRDYAQSIGRIQSRKILKFINEFSQAQHFDRVVLNYVMGGNQQRGARFVMQWVSRHVPVSQASRLVFEQSHRGRRYSDLLWNNVKFEFKNVMQLSNNSELRRQLSYDLNLLFSQQALGPNRGGVPNGLKWVFAGNRGLHGGNIRTTLNDIINSVYANHPRRRDMLQWVQRHVIIWSP
ncbi:hypothetical protein [Maribacter sp. 1_MG-2023]|uniref:hypothetical protein n=1 Tax=Maribacter sp. 1_MG-2023 TaxID=3062677 RepID=UPI0026E25DE2|nr:hypothetical protein [Maribacter sp. 1_MG-2023]MDO6472757.1 hypothetical protein [Maribacter sp. 1_MG-2023]